jgi:hypothetical protein
VLVLCILAIPLVPSQHGQVGLLSCRGHFPLGQPQLRGPVQGRHPAVVAFVMATRVRKSWQSLRRIRDWIIEADKVRGKAFPARPPLGLKGGAGREDLGVLFSGSVH